MKSVSVFYVFLGALFLPTALNYVAVEEMFPFGEDSGDSRLPTYDDDFQNVTFSLGNVFSFFNDTYNEIFINNNGALSFTQGVRQYTPTCGPLTAPMIVPFWADVDTRRGGTVFYRETKNSTLLMKASNEIQKAFPDLRNLRLGWMFITTWHEVGFFGASASCNGLSLRNTFQTILTTDGYYSFALFYYNKITWTTGTASGGNCTGQGGTPAKAGFDVGDRETFFEIPGTCTSEIQQVTNASNVNQPGKWMFRIDQSFESRPCEGYPPTERLRISPAFVSILGHIPLTIRGPCLENAENVECHFYDSSKVTVPGEILEDDAAAVCNVPYLYSHGKIKVEMTVTHDNATQTTYSGYIFTTEPDGSQVTFELLQNSNANLTWMPSLFNDIDFEEDFKLQLNLVEYNGTSWIPRGILIDNLTNTGNYEGPLNSTAITLFNNLTYFAVVQLNVVHLRETIKSVFSDIIYTPINKTQQYFISKCDSWYQGDNGPPKDILPCPPLLQQALQDDRFEQDGATGDVLQFFHPGAEYSFRQRVPSANGAGQQCVYKNGTIMLGPPGGGTADFYSPNYGYIDHFQADVWPWLICCKFSNDSESCRKYYEKRPSDSGHNYVPPRPGNGAGDPHITTFDLVSYTFNGVGEFWMIKGDNDSFLMQSRMEQFVDENGTLANASIFTSFAMQESGPLQSNSENGNVHVQVSNTYSGIEVLLDREPLFDMASENNETNIGTRSLTYNGVSISQLVSENGYSTKVTVSFSSGFSFEFTPSGDTALNIIASASAQSQNKTKGLFGVFDGNPANDFTDPNDATISLNSTLQEIHELFGIKWITTANESIFVYPPGKNHSSYNNPNFVPSFVLPDISSLPSDVITLCGESRDCLFDFAATGSRSLANNTKEVVVAFNTSVEELAEEIGMCEILTEPQNGFYQASSYLEGSVAIFGCSEGYNLVGQNQLTCTKLSNSLCWDYETPKCQKIDFETTTDIPLTTTDIPLTTTDIPLTTTNSGSNNNIHKYKFLAIVLALCLTYNTW